MSIYSYFFNAQQKEGVYDRTYTAGDMTSYLDGIVGSGVFPAPSDCLQVCAGSGMTVLVKPGAGWIEGHKIINTAELELDIDPGDVTLNRIDRIVFRVNNLNREMEIVVKKGQNSSSPSAPEIIRDQDMIEYSLATVEVKRNTTAITNAVIRDTRMDSAVCGYVQGLIQQVGTSTLYNQWTAAYDQQYEEYTAAFEAWFNEIKENLKDVVMWQEYKNAVVTKSDYVQTVNIGIPQYNDTLDILTVYVNGMRLDNTEYSATETQVTFTKPLDVIGTTIEFVVYKSVNADDAITVAEQVQDHENRITELEDVTHVYECTGTDDNKKLSQLAQDFLRGVGEFIKYTRRMTVKVTGDFSNMSSPVAGSGTEDDPYIYMILGKYNNTETGEDSTNSTRKITFDFTDCSQISNRIYITECNQVMIAGDEIDIIGMSISNTGAPKYKQLVGGKKPRLRDCEIIINGGEKAFGALHGGTFERCTFYLIGSVEAIGIQSDGTTPLIATDCYIRVSSDGMAIGIYAPEGLEESVVIAERCNITKTGNESNTYTVQIESGYCSLSNNIMWKAPYRYTTDINKCPISGNLIINKPL